MISKTFYSFQFPFSCSVLVDQKIQQRKAQNKWVQTNAVRKGLGKLSVFHPADRLNLLASVIKKPSRTFLATMFVCNSNRLPWWALLSTWQPPREKATFMPSCMEGSPLPPKPPRLMCNRPPPSDVRPIGSQFLTRPHPPRPYCLQPPGLLDPSPLKRCPETWVMDGDSWWTSQDPSYEGIGQVTHLACCSREAQTALKRLECIRERESEREEREREGE